MVGKTLETLYSTFFTWCCSPYVHFLGAVFVLRVLFMCICCTLYGFVVLGVFIVLLCVFVVSYVYLLYFLCVFVVPYVYCCTMCVLACKNISSFWLGSCSCSYSGPPSLCSRYTAAFKAYCAPYVVFLLVPTFAARCLSAPYTTRDLQAAKVGTILWARNLAENFSLDLPTSTFSLKFFYMP